MNTKLNQYHSSYVNSSPQPTHYKLSLDCHHSPVMSVEDIKASYVEARSNYHSDNSRDHYLICPLCKVHAPGSCDRTPLHKVVYMTPRYSKQTKEHEQRQQQPEQEQQALEHFRFPQFLRATKKAYLSYLSIDNYHAIANLGCKTNF